MQTTRPYIKHHVYVDVLADYLWVAEDASGELYFPIRPSCAALELDSTTALETIKDDSRLSVGLESFRLPTPGGEQPMQCLRSDEYTWWLALINPKRFKPERRSLLEVRQRVLMRLAKEIMLRRLDLKRIPQRQAPSPQPINMSIRASGDARCPHCNGPVLVTYDGVDWHLHAGVQVE